MYHGHLAFNVLYRKISKLLKLESAVALYILAWSKFPESVQLVSLALLIIRVVQTRKSSYPNPRHFCIKFYHNHAAIAWFVCLCMLVVFQVSWGRFNSSSLLSVPREAFKSVKDLVQPDARHVWITLYQDCHLVGLSLILVVFQVWERFNSSCLLSKPSEAFQIVKGHGAGLWKLVIIVSWTRYEVIIDWDPY